MCWFPGCRLTAFKRKDPKTIMEPENAKVEATGNLEKEVVPPPAAQTRTPTEDSVHRFGRIGGPRRGDFLLLPFRRAL